jgi:hypothetical protein
LFPKRASVTPIGKRTGRDICIAPDPNAYAYFKNGWLKQVKGQKYVSDAWSDMTQVDYEYDEAGNALAQEQHDE